MGKKILLVFLIPVIILAGLFYFRNRVYFSHGSYRQEKMFEIEKGEGNAEVASRLAQAGLISGKIYFYYYIRSHGLLNRIMPGEYQLSGAMTIPEIAGIITNPEDKFAKVTFPEGFTARQMADRLSANGLPGEEFLKIVENPGDFKKRYSYLTPVNVSNLEGYLFPDTYFFKKDISAENIVGRLLDTFDEKLAPAMREDIEKNGKSISEIMIMASIIEKEVQAFQDMKVVSGIFWNRLGTGQRLQSDAPLSYILGDNVDQHSGADLALDSPYNTYRYAGLPPGPISNPGLNAIRAAIYPEPSDYNFFLTATVGGAKQVFYARTFEEHVANKQKNGM